MMANRRPTATSRLKTKASRTINTEHLALSAPIALHPNTLLTQSLIASAFPLQFAQATRWAEESADKALSGGCTNRRGSNDGHTRGRLTLPERMMAR